MRPILRKIPTRARATLSAYLVFAVWAGIGASAAKAETVSAVASTPALPLAPVHSIELPVYPGQKDSPRFRYAYQRLRGTASAPTIIFLPGGPGDTSISAPREIAEELAHLGLPANGNVILTDPRSVGRNHGDAARFPDDSLTTENLARDVLGLVRALGLKDYFLYGHSFGTMQATLAASLARQARVPPPRALVLSGTIGRGEAEGKLSDQYGLRGEWQRMRAELPAAAVSALSGSEAPLGVSWEEWTEFVLDGLRAGAVIEKGAWTHPLREDLSLLGGHDAAALAALKLKVRDPTAGPPETGELARIFTVINCREISDQEYELRLSHKGLEIRPGTDACAKRPLSLPFDSARWPVTVPVIYVAGTRDPSAPMEQTLYHFDHQAGAPRMLIAIPDGGHNPLGPSLGDCKEVFWKAISQLTPTRLPALLKPALARCLARPEIMRQESPAPTLPAAP